MRHGGFFATMLFCAASVLAAQDGATLYQQNCASCHDGGMDRAPSRDSLKAMSADRVLAAMESGPMISRPSPRPAVERRVLAEFVTGKALTGTLETKPLPKALCASAPSADL